MTPIKYSLTFLLIFMMNGLFAQIDDQEGIPKSLITVSYGRASTHGNYAKTNQDRESGFAENGTVFTLGFQHFYQENTAFTFRYGRSKNPFASVSYSNVLAEFDRVDTISWYTRAEDYSVNYGLIGLKWVKGDQAKLYINPMIGLGNFQSPEVDVKATFASGLSVDQTIRSSEVYELMFGLSGGLDVVVANGVLINFDLLYLVGEFNYTAELETYNSFGMPTVVSESVEQGYSTLNISIGLGIGF